jgi:tetratricopeptide (TPR) repeat protein
MTAPEFSASRKPRDFATFALIVCAAFVAYLPALHGSLLWDDSSHVTASALRSFEGLRRIWFDLGATQQYYPLLHSVFWLEHRLWGDATVGYHVVNVALHALAACLLVLVVRRLALPGGWLAGLLFAVHPLCVEAVAWISEQKSTLSGVFYLAAALAYLGFDEDRRRWRYWTAFGLFLCALAAKTVTATLPGALLVAIWWRRGRLEWRRDVRPLMPWLAAGAAAGLFTAWVERTYIGAGGAEFALSTAQRVLLAGRALWFYAGKVIWPADLTFFYPRWNLDAVEWTQWLLTAGALSAGIGLSRLAPARRGPLAAFLIFTGTLFPALGFVNVYPFRYSWVADHFAYLAVPAIVVPAAAVLARRRVFTAAGVILACVLGVLTWRQSGDYRDAGTLYRATLRRNPDAWLAHNNLGNLLMESGGSRDEAAAHFQAALRANPEFWEAHLSLGNALAGMPGRLNEAIGEFEIAARLAPEADRPHTNLGNALLDAGRTAEAIEQLQIALRLQPASPEAHNDLGNAWTRTGRIADATGEYQAALRIDPDFAEAHNNLGRALAQSGRLAEGIAEFQAAIRIRPEYAGAHSNLGIALAQSGRLQDAIAEYRTALRIRPDSPTAHNNLGFALAQRPDGLAEAVAEYREAVRLAPGFVDAHYNLAMALRRMPGRAAEAAMELETVRRLQGGEGPPAR